MLAAHVCKAGALFGAAEGELVSNGAGGASGVGAADPNGQATPEGGPKFDLADLVFAPGSLAWLSQVGFVALVELFGEFWFFGISHNGPGDGDGGEEIEQKGESSEFGERE